MGSTSVLVPSLLRLRGSSTHTFRASMTHAPLENPTSDLPVDHSDGYEEMAARWSVWPRKSNTTPSPIAHTTGENPSTRSIPPGPRPRKIWLLYRIKLTIAIPPSIRLHAASRPFRLRAPILRSTMPLPANRKFISAQHMHTKIEIGGKEAGKNTAESAHCHECNTYPG